MVPPARILWFVVSVSLLLFVACGDTDGADDDPDTTGISGAWVANGDYVVQLETADGDDVETWQFPSDPLPELSDDELCDDPQQGTEFFPQRDIGPEHGAVQWNTRLAADSEHFEMGYTANASASASGGEMAWERHGAGENSYVVEILNVDDEPLYLDARWSVTADIDAGSESNDASASLDVNTRLFVDGCEEVSADYDLLEYELNEETDEVDDEGEETFEVDAERVVVVVEASGEVFAESDDLEGAGATAVSWLDFDYEVEVVR